MVVYTLLFMRVAMLKSKKVMFRLPGEKLSSVNLCQG